MEISTKTPCTNNNKTLPSANANKSAVNRVIEFGLVKATKIVASLATLPTDDKMEMCAERLDRH